MKKFLLFAVVAILFAACTQDVAVEILSPNIADDAPDTLTVGFEGDDTRIQLNENVKTVWTNGDQVSVFYRSDANQKWEYTGETGARIADLTRVDEGVATEDMKRVVVVYPYNENYYINTDTFNVQATLPAVQTYLKDSYGLNGNIMISQGEYNDISLKSVCGWLKLQLTGNGETVKSITLRGNNGEQVAGELYINSADATAILSSDAGSADDGEIGGVGGDLVFEDTILKEVTLDCDEGVELGTEATAFYIALPPQTFENGFTVEIEAMDGHIMTKSTDKTLTIERNHIQPMTAFTADFPVPETWKIYYTATQKVEPNDKTVFGATYLSNVWDSETGEGIITFDGDVTMIGYSAFNGYVTPSLASTLTSVTIPDSVTAVGKMSFYGCDSLAEFKGKFTADNGRCLIVDNVLVAFACGCGVSEYSIPNGVTKVGYGAFYRASSLTKINFANSVKYIDGHAFQRTGIVNLVIPDHILSIGEYAFDFCKNLESVTIGDGVGLIDHCAFYGCSNLTNVTIGRGVGTINGDAWGSCYNLEKVYCLSIVPPSIGNYNIFAFSDTPEIYVYDEAYTAYKSAWSKYAEYIYKNGSNPDTSTITIEYTTSDNQIITPTGLSVKSNEYSNGVGTITIRGCVVGGFSDAETLVSVNIQNGATALGMGAFRNCTNLSSVTIPDSVASIGDEAFSGCSRLTNLAISDSVTSIGERVFESCTSLTSITIPNNVTSIGYHAFSRCSSLTSITIPDGVTSIGNYAFYYCKSLTSVNIPDSVTSIGEYAFYECSSLTSITIPSGIRTLYDGTFSWCSKLKEVYIKSSTPIYLYGKPFGTYYDTRFYVPASDDDSIINAYKEASGWSEYKDYIFEEE